MTVQLTGTIISSLFKISAFNEMLLIGLSNGGTMHLVFMTLLQSERCSRLGGMNFSLKT